jgi:F-type H+-transporting ATPase subunit b
MRKAAYGALAVVAASVSPAFAAEGGMPQLNFHDFPPQIVWLVVTFVALYLVLSQLAMPAISGILERRQAKIQGDLDAAEKASEETRALVAAYEKRLADAREDARRLQRTQNEADNAAASQRLAELGQRLGARIDEAEKRIAAQRSQVMEGIEQMATDIAAEVYAKVSGQPADQAALGAKVAAAKGGI